MIKMIKGTYGLEKADGSVEAMTPASGPFSINEKKEAELVSLGVAVKVESPKTVNDEDKKTGDLRKKAAKRSVDVKAAKGKSEAAAIEAADAKADAAEVKE